MKRVLISPNLHLVHCGSFYWTEDADTHIKGIDSVYSETHDPAYSLFWRSLERMYSCICFDQKIFEILIKDV